MIEWPNRSRCAVSFTFDLDAEVLWSNFLNRQGITKHSPKLLSLGVYGPKVAVPKLIRLFGTYGLKACFFVPGIIAERYPERIREIVQAGHEIGHHSYSHRNFSTLTYAEEEVELERGSSALKSVANVTPTGFRLPVGDMSVNTLSLLTKHGFLYDSSLNDDDVPYLLEGGERPLVELPVPPDIDDWNYYGFNKIPPFEYQSGIRTPNEYLEVLLQTFEGVYREGDCLVLLMHPQAQGRPGRMVVLERFVQHLLAKGDVWVTTPGEIAKFWLAREQSKKSTATF